MIFKCAFGVVVSIATLTNRFNKVNLVRQLLQTSRNCLIFPVQMLPLPPVNFVLYSNLNCPFNDFIVFLLFFNVYIYESFTKVLLCDSTMDLMSTI